MTPRTPEDWTELLGIRDRAPPHLLRSPTDLDSSSRPIAQAHALRRAFEQLKLDGVLCIESAPVCYIKIVERLQPRQVQEWQRLLWNQGLAPLLIVASQQDVRVYSGLALPATSAEAVDEDHRLIVALERIADAAKIHGLGLAIETGEFFRTHAAAFDPSRRVDRRLLENLTSARKLLRDAERPRISQQLVDALVCRIVFASYLVDRGVITQDYFTACGITDASGLKDIFKNRKNSTAGRLLYKLFASLKRDFNGDLFAAELDTEQQSLTDNHVDVLRRFLTGEELASGQLSFLDYDFRVIPIETISSIYERFLADKPNEKGEVGAFYTPRFLAEVTLDIALGNTASLLDKRFLDPACGSGIFLVGLFNRLAEEWRRAHPRARYDTRAEAFIGILRHNIFGIDQSETACRIASFSLYLALLDQLDPPDIQQLQQRGKVLPRLVFELGEAANSEAGHTLLHASFGQADAVLPKEGFHIIIGNPPWVSRSGTSDDTAATAASWPHDTAAVVAQKQLAHRFIWKAARHTAPAGHVCFLLPHGVLFNHDDKALAFQRSWLEQCVVEEVVNLADLRFILFEDAIRPALIVRYRPAPAPESIDGAIRDPDYLIAYDAPKVNWSLLRADILVIPPEDRTTFSVRQVLLQLKREEPPSIWKERHWGTPRDWRFLDRLFTLPRLGDITGQPHKGEDKRWVVGQGFQPWGDSDEEKWLKSDKKKHKPKPGYPAKENFVEGMHDFNLLLLLSDTRTVGDDFKKLRRRPEADKIFDAPHVLVTKGLRVAYASFRVLFRHAVQGITGPATDASLLMFLAAYLDSDLARYTLFHTVANWGNERPEVHLDELLRLPFGLPDSMPDIKGARSVVDDVARLMTACMKQIQNLVIGREQHIASVKEELRQLVYRYFDIDDAESVLIKDTVDVFMPSVTPHREGRAGAPPTLQTTDTAERMRYCERLRGTLEQWAGASRFSATTTVSNAMGLGFVTVSRVRTGKTTQGERNAPEALDEALARVWPLLLEHRRSVAFSRGLTIFDGPTLHVVKPLTRRYWTESAALNDADEIAAAILKTTTRDRA